VSHTLHIGNIQIGLLLAVTATAGPAVASLTGDYFPAAERARIYGLILGGELVGAGLGYVVSGDLSAITTWRAAYWWLAVPSLALAWVVRRLPEPARGGASHIPAGAAEVHGEEELSAQEQEAGAERPGDEGQAPGLAAEIARQDEVAPQEELVLEQDPGGQSLWWVLKYVIRVRTNVVIIIASALGYFYFAGLRTFAVIFATGHYGISKPFATALIVVIGVGSLAGVFVGGRVADGLLRRGYLRARVIVPAVSLFALLPALAGALVVQSIALALPLLVISAFLLGAPNPALDAARLDIMPPSL
jgi:predicted MFS family arabinose efflux permease